MKELELHRFGGETFQRMQLLPTLMDEGEEDIKILCALLNSSVLYIVSFFPQKHLLAFLG